MRFLICLLIFDSISAIMCSTKLLANISACLMAVAQEATERHRLVSSMTASVLARSSYHVREAYKADGGRKPTTRKSSQNPAPASSLASYRLCKRYVKRNRFPLFMLYTPGGLSWKDGRRDEQIAHMSPARETHDDHGSRL